MFFLLLSFAECFARRRATLSRVYEKSNNTVLEVVPPSSHSISLRVGEKPNRDKRVLRKSRPAFSPSDRERQMKKFFCAKMERESPTAHPSPCLYRVPAREMNADGFQGLRRRRRHWGKKLSYKSPLPPYPPLFAPVGSVLSFSGIAPPP